MLTIPKIDINDLRQTGGVHPNEALSVIEKGHPPIADKLILLDFDGCVAPFGYLFSFPPPFDGVVDFTHIMKNKGYRIGIFTSRLSPTWLDSANQSEDEHIDYIIKYCIMFNIKFDFLTAEKVPSEQMFDDKATNVHDNWREIIEVWK